MACAAACWSRNRFSRTRPISAAAASIRSPAPRRWRRSAAPRSTTTKSGSRRLRRRRIQKLKSRLQFAAILPLMSIEADEADREMADKNSVLREKRWQALWITINRPDKRNAINGDVVAGIAKGYRDAHDDKNVRVIVLTGAGDKAFCAGADLQNSGAAFAMDFAKPNVDYADLLRLSQNATKPAIARVGGVCMAGGMGLLCMTDMAVAADHVMFGLPEVKVGVFPMQVMALLQSVAPRRLVNEWALTGEPFDARTAQAAGLLNYVVPASELDAKLDWLISRIVDKSPTAIRRGKYAMRAIASMSFDESIAYTESQIAILAMTEDAKEGLKAFSEKRKPVWPGLVQ